MDGNIVHGTVEILNTPSGKILQSLVFFLNQLILLHDQKSLILLLA